MFGVTIPDGPHIVVEVRLSLGKGWPILAWKGPGKAPDGDVIDDIIRSANVMQYIGKAVERGRVKTDDLGTCMLPAKLLVYNGQEFLFDAAVEFPLNISPNRDDPANPALFLERMFIAYTASLKDITAAATSAIKSVSDSHHHTLQAGHTQLGIIANTADKVSGLSTEIFKDSNERTAALIHEIRHGTAAQTRKSDDPLKEIKGFMEIFRDMQALIPSDDKDASKPMP